MSEKENDFDFQDDDVFAMDEADFDSVDDSADVDGFEEDTAAMEKKPKKSGFSLSPSGIVAMVKEAPLAYGFGVVILLAAIYMLNLVMGGDDSNQAAQAQAQTQSFGASVPANVAKFNDNTVNHTPQHAATNNMASGGYIQMTQSDMTALLKGFAEQNAKSVSGLDKEIKRLQTSVTDGNQSQATMMHQVQELSETQHKLSEQMQNTNKYLKTISASLTATKTQLQVLMAEQTAHAEKLTLRAVVPGRAWLVDGKGKTLTITEGSELEGFGKVTKIDSDADKVYMSSGYVFS